MNALIEGVLTAVGAFAVIVYLFIAMALTMSRQLIPGLISVVMLFGFVGALSIWTGMWPEPPLQKMFGFAVAFSVIAVVIGSLMANRRRVVKND